MWPQVALTHHAKLSNRIEPYLVHPVNPAILSKDLLNRPELIEVQFEAWK